MILNYDHYHASRKKGLGKRIVAVVVGLLVCAAIVAAFAFRLPQRLLPASGARAGLGKLPELWKDSRYDDVISVSDAVLRNDPLNPSALTYRGFASFYKATSQTSADRSPILDDAVLFLRRAELVGSPMARETDYVLAKAYFFKGKFYYDLAVSYMNRAISRGYVQNDSYELLGTAYTQLGDYDKGIACFLKALDAQQSDILLLTIGQTYYQMKQTGEAVDYLLRTLNKTEDKAIEEKARLLLGEIYLDRNELFKAEEQYSALTQLDPQSADAHFFLGEVYAKMNDPVKARSEWRAAFQIDPTHYGAKLRLFK